MIDYVQVNGYKLYAACFFLSWISYLTLNHEMASRFLNLPVKQLSIRVFDVVNVYFVSVFAFY